MSERPLGEGYTRRDGIVYGPDGKPCRSCNSLKDLFKLSSSDTSSSSSSSSSSSLNTSAPFSFSKRPKLDTNERITNQEPAMSTTESVSAAEHSAEEDLPGKVEYDASSCPPDVELLGRSTWTFLHSTAANYPTHPTAVQQTDMSDFIRLFSRLYPCWTCAEEFREWLARRENEPVLDKGWQGLGQWMCRAHNEVNKKLGKQEFDCNLWRQRWKDGFKDGRCDP